MYACGKGHVETCKILLTAKAMADLQDSDGWTALIWSVEKGTIICSDQLNKLEEFFFRLRLKT